MRKLMLGIVAAATLLTAAAPAMAQVSFYARPGGVGIGVGPPSLALTKCATGHTSLARRPRKGPPFVCAPRMPRQSK
jgi:hypothetical protein